MRGRNLLTVEGKRGNRLIQLLHESSAASPESGILSDWSKKQQSLSHIPIGYTIACLTSGAISKQEAGMATVEGDANSEFSAGLTTSLDDFIHKSLKDEQTECIRRIPGFKVAWAYGKYFDM